MVNRGSAQLPPFARACLLATCLALCAIVYPACRPSVADLPIEEARQLAQEFAVYDLTDASVRGESRDGDRLAVFEVEHEVTRRVEYAVNLSRGRIVWWHDSPGPSAAGATPATDGERVSAEQAIAIVKEVATRALDEDVSAMTWTTPKPSGEGHTVSGRRPAWGDPPRTSGLNPDVSARVSASGRVEYYHQLLPSEAPAEVVITEPQATEVALAHAVELGIPEYDVHLQYVRLVQRGSRAYWDINVTDYAPGITPTSPSRSVIYEINARTGEIESAGLSGPFGRRGDRRPRRSTASPSGSRAGKGYM
ncbi:MAG: hypothetical protein ACOX6M_15365 [Armatimonadota bacterium]